MSLTRTKARIKRDAKILREKIRIQRKKLKKSYPKLKKKMPKLRRKALARGKEIELYFKSGIDPRNFRVI